MTVATLSTKVIVRYYFPHRTEKDNVTFKIAMFLMKNI